MKFCIFLIISFALFSSCDFSSNNFGDVHLTDDNGNAIGGGSDQNEWLFSSETCNDDENRMFPAYPNPFIDQLFVAFNTSDVAVFTYFIIDEDEHLIVELQSDTFAKGFNQVQINLESLESETTVRIEYTLVVGDCTYNGYGDILRQ